MTEEEIDEQAVNFEKICTQKFQTLDDHNGYVRNETSDSNDDAERYKNVSERKKKGMR